MNIRNSMCNIFYSGYHFLHHRAYNKKTELNFNKQMGYTSELDIENSMIYAPQLKESYRKHLKKHFKLTNQINKADVFLGWGMSNFAAEIQKIASYNKKPFSLIEDGFVRSAHTWCADVKAEDTSGLSYCLDSKGFYFDGTRSTDLECLLNSYMLNDDEISQARKLIDKIVVNNITKYNHQPIRELNYSTEKKRVLIIDQSYRDQSLKMGLVDDEVFGKMIEDAVKENPNSEILFKIHPDTIAGGVKTRSLN